MRKIDNFIAGATLAMWLIFIFKGLPSIGLILLGMGIGWTITRLVILTNDIKDLR